MENLDKLVEELRKYPNETPWLEFKHNNYDPRHDWTGYQRACQQRSYA